MNPARGTLRGFPDPAALAQAGAEFLCERAESSTGPFVVALSGGSTPKPLYQLLALEPFRARLPWDRIHWVLGDERFVKWSDPASNFGMICGAFLSHVPAPSANIHPVPTEDVTLEEAAQRYEDMLKELYGAETLSADRPLLSVNFLGLGEDGHTASLLPGQPALQERERWVVPVSHGRAEPRITLTYRALESTRYTVFLVTGAKKAAILDKVLSGDTETPAGRLHPAGELVWFADQEAAGGWAK
ncbi:MAG: 6-phosphogluconolactonase [Acetobacteraceae bacterium]|nr:6-phosphogluconolactonase [Acetobacteraceae bacterium]